MFSMKFGAFKRPMQFLGAGALLFLMLGLSTQPSFAQNEVYVTGVSTIELRRSCRDDRPRDEEDYESALRAAKINALQSWGATQSAAVANLIADSNGVIMAGLDEYLLNPYIKKDCTNKTFQLSVRAQLNTAALNRVMASSNEVQGPRSRMTAVFVARKQTSVKRYQDKVTQISENTQMAESDAVAEFASGNVSGNESSTTRSISVSGGSAESKSDKITYSVFQADGLDAAVNETFTSFGFRLIDASQVAGRFPGFDLDEFKQDFGVGDDLAPGTKNAAFDAISGKIPLLVIATVDVLNSDIDPVSGLARVFVAVKGQVFQDDGLFFETVASVAPTQYAGIGPSETVAETNALIEAAKAASQEIVNQLNAAGIR